jgi:hypothetical protein
MNPRRHPQLGYGPFALTPRGLLKAGARDGIRTRDTRDHNPVLYQLSYSRH